MRRQASFSNQSTRLEAVFVPRGQPHDTAGANRTKLPGIRGFGWRRTFTGCTGESKDFFWGGSTEIIDRARRYFCLSLSIGGGGRSIYHPTT